MNLSRLFAPSAGPAIFSSVQVDLGSLAISLPVFRRQNGAGKTLLVTAGMDGDEYASIEAAYRLAEQYHTEPFAGTLIVIPILNLPGFQEEVSFNPLDHKYPKYIQLGNAKGSPSERLMHWLLHTYAEQADAWIDLHGGALTEQLIPFAWLFETGHAAVDTVAAAILERWPAQPVVYEPVARGGRREYLARHGCTSMILEAGAQGIVSESDVQYHLRFTELVLNVLGMREGMPATSVQPRPLRHVAYATVPWEGVWYPAVSAGQTVMAGQELGMVRSFNRRHHQRVVTHHAGTVLWNKVGLYGKSGATVAAVGIHP